MIRRLLAALAATALAGLVASSALAGGHVDIKADALPAKIEAGQTVNVGFTIAFPGGEPVEDAKPVVRMRSGRRTLEVPAVATKTPGTYLASVKVPTAGNWSVVVDSKHCGNTCTLSPITACAVNSKKNRVAAR